MILVPRAVRVYFATQPTNLCNSFDAITADIRCAPGHDPLSGHVFVFLNRRKNQVKLIVDARRVHDRAPEARAWDLHVSARVAPDVPSVAIDVHELAMLHLREELPPLRTEARVEISGTEPLTL